jgi:hypothetical protein
MNFPPASFQFDLQNLGNTTQLRGSLDWDREKASWKATITVGSDPAHTFEAWSDCSRVACLLCIGRFMGRDLVDVTDDKEENAE